MSIALLKPLITLLADGEYHSGQVLGQAAGVSRAAVWKRLQMLEPYGLAVQSTKGLGYRIAGGLDLLNADAIRRGLSDRARSLVGEVQVHDEIDSTNLRLLNGPAASGDVCVAEYQSAGKGRRGRTWVSPYGCNLYFSLCWQVHQGVAALEGLSLAVGVVIAEVLARFGLARVALKWPNDILLDGKKLAGVLIEVGGDLSGECRVVVGVGLNVRMTQSPNSAAVNQAWTDLASNGIEASRNMLCSALVSALLECLAGFAESGFAGYRQRWLQRAAFLNEPVQLLLPSRQVNGVLRGVDLQGGLELEVDGRAEVFTGGEISLRGSDAAG